MTDDERRMARPRSDPPNIARIREILEEITALREETADRLAALEHQVVQLCRDVGSTWEQIGDEIGVARQTAEKRFKQPRRRRRTR